MIAGMDEAGRGPAIGPLVFGIVIATQDQLNQLENQGVTDSKQLSKSKREEYQEIIEETVDTFDTLVVSASKIDIAREQMSLNDLEVQSFRQLLQPYTTKIRELQLDAADVNAERFGNQFKDMIDGKIDSRHKGDSIFIAVGAASILAKLQRDKIIDELQVQMDNIDNTLPSFGSGYPTQAKPFLEAYVKKYKALPKIARKSWKTSKDAKEKYVSEQADLDDFF